MNLLKIKKSNKKQSTSFQSLSEGVGWLDTSLFLYLFKWPFRSGKPALCNMKVSILEDVEGEGDGERLWERFHWGKKKKRKTQDFSVFRETEAVNEAERVRCADRFLSSLKKSRALDFCTPSFVFWHNLFGTDLD